MTIIANIMRENARLKKAEEMAAEVAAFKTQVLKAMMEQAKKGEVQFTLRVKAHEKGFVLPFRTDKDSKAAFRAVVKEVEKESGLDLRFSTPDDAFEEDYGTGMFTGTPALVKDDPRPE